MTKPVALPKIAGGLMRMPDLAKCPRPPRVDYDVLEIAARAECFEADRDAHRARLRGLQRAVRVRETIVAKAVKAGQH